MNIFSIPTLIGSLSTLSIGFLVLTKNKKSEINVSFFLMCLSIFTWLFSYTVAYSVTSKTVAFFWTKLACTAVIFAPVTFYHFIVSYLKKEREKIIVLFTYGLAIIMFLFFVKTNYFLSGTYKYYWGYYSKAGPLHPLYLVYHFLIIARYFLLVFVEYFKVKDINTRDALQMKYIFWSSIIITPSAIDYIPKYGFEFYPFGWTFIVFYVVVVSYAIVKHHLMEIEVIIKRTLVFAGMFVFVFGVFVGMSLLISHFIGGGSTISLLVSAVLITIGLRPIEALLINTTNKYLFQKKHEYKEIISAFTDEVATVLDLDKVISSTLDILSKTIYPETAAIFLYNKAEDKYESYSSLGLEDKRITLANDSKLIQYLKNFKDLALIKQIDGYIGVDPDIQKEMHKLKALFCLPFLLHDDLIGFISLGKKKSDEEYSKDDLDILKTLARTETISIANSQLLTEAAQAEKSAAIGAMAAGIHHEVGNPLNIINTKIQLFFLKLQKGLFKDKSQEEVIKECRDILKETISQTNRIADITKKLASFAKPSKEIKPELVSIPQEVEETLEVIGHDLKIERITIEKDIEENLPQILADKRQIQQILFNLIKNAGQAIEKEGKITIKASSLNGKVHIEIIDTGKGILEDKIHRIFEPFFTTKGPKEGTGLGLSIVRQLVWRNKGEISVTSKIGEGTRFVLEFPSANTQK